MRPHVASCALGVAVLLGGSREGRAVDASTVRKLTLEEAAASCELALEARVTSRSSTLDASGRIGTDYAVTVARTFAGTHAAARTIRLPGGVLPDGRGLVLPGLPSLAVGEDAILFLSGENARGERLPVGLAQGRLRVERSAADTRYVVNDLSGLDLVDAQGHPVPVEVGTSALPYDVVLARIEAACSRRSRGTTK